MACQGNANRAKPVRSHRTWALLAVLGSAGVGLSGCIAYDVAATAVDAGATVVDAGATVVTTAGAIVSAPFGGADKPADKK